MKLNILRQTKEEYTQYLYYLCLFTEASVLNVIHIKDGLLVALSRQDPGWLWYHAKFVSNHII